MLKAIIKGNRLVNKINIEHYKGHFLVSYKMKKVEINRVTGNQQLYRKIFSLAENIRLFQKKKFLFTRNVFLL